MSADSQPPAAPWTIEYADGSANRSRLAQASADADVAFEYVPVTRAQSSTGMYDGGPPRQARLAPDDPRVAEVWRRIAALQADPARHAAARVKGSGAFTVTTAAGVAGFLIDRGDAILELDALLAGIG